MTVNAGEQARCQLCGKTLPTDNMLPAGLVRKEFLPIIQQQAPGWSSEGYICFTCLNQVRAEYIRALLEKDLGELDELEQEVVRSLQNQELVAENIYEEYDESLTFGQRLADRVAEFGGSWKFILYFSGFLALWIIINTVVIFFRPFDPYPYILLNLVLSLLAAFQAPVIMMSQNRQEARDRLRAENDYQVNLKAELEVRIMNEKLDQILHHELPRLIEIQAVQAEMVNELHNNRQV